MEQVAPFKLTDLRRDWIEGISGKIFYRQVCAQMDSLQGRAEPLVIREKDPRDFAVQFFAGVGVGCALVLANPNWGTQEQEELASLLDGAEMAPASISIPTGGTTGGVKLAIHDWQSLYAGACAVWDFLGGDAVHACCLLPMYHVSGLMQLLRSFVSGGRIRFNDDDTAGYCLSLVPTQLQRRMQDEAGIRKMREARVVFVGGAAMPGAVEQKARELKLPVVSVYGMTETAAMVAAIPNEDFLNSPGAGSILLGDARAAIDADGSIRLWGSSLFKGYLGCESIRPEKGFRTGDAGWLDADGRLHLQGRMDHLINTGGEKVDPAEVRHALLEIEGIADARVVGKPDEEWGEIVVAYICYNRKGSALGESYILSALKQKLSNYKIPKQIIPENKSGSKRPKLK